MGHEERPNKVETTWLVDGLNGKNPSDKCYNIKCLLTQTLYICKTKKFCFVVFLPEVS